MIRGLCDFSYECLGLCLLCFGCLLLFEVVVDFVLVGILVVCFG